MESYKEKIIRMVIERDELMRLEDGMIYWWPEGGRGALSPYNLRVLADYLDLINGENNPPTKIV